jgi:hypothetical protein
MFYVQIGQKNIHIAVSLEANENNNQLTTELIGIIITIL